MEKLLYKTLSTISLINDSLNKPIITKEEFEEEEENIKKFAELTTNLISLLDCLKEKKTLNNVDLMNEKLVYLHLYYCDIIWHVDQIHELMTKIIKVYPD